MAGIGFCGSYFLAGSLGQGAVLPDSFSGDQPSSSTQKQLSQAMVPFSSPIPHLFITPVPQHLCTVHAVMIIRAGLYVSLQVFLCVLCLYERSLWFLCVCVCKWGHMLCVCTKSHTLCVAVYLLLIRLTIFSPMEVGGISPSSLGRGETGNQRWWLSKTESVLPPAAS